MAWCGQNSLHLKQAQQRWLFHGYTEPSFFTNTPIEHRSIQTQLVVQRSGSIYTSNCTVVGQLTSMVLHALPAGKRPFQGGFCPANSAGVPAGLCTCRVQKVPSQDRYTGGVHKNIGTMQGTAGMPRDPLSGQPGGWTRDQGKGTMQGIAFIRRYTHSPVRMPGCRKKKT